MSYTLAPVGGLAVIFFLWKLACAPLRMERERCAELEERLKAAEQIIADSRSAAQTMRDPRTDVRLLLIPRLFTCLYRSNDKLDLRTHELILPKEHREVKITENICVGLLNTGDKAARDISLEWRFECNGLSRRIDESGLFKPVLIRHDHERGALELRKVIRREGKGGHEELSLVINYATSGMTNCRFLPPATEAGNRHQAVVGSPQEVTAALALYVVTEFYKLASCLPEECPGINPSNDDHADIPEVRRAFAVLDRSERGFFIREAPAIFVRPVVHDTSKVDQEHVLRIRVYVCVPRDKKIAAEGGYWFSTHVYLRPEP